MLPHNPNAAPIHSRPGRPSAWLAVERVLVVLSLVGMGLGFYARFFM